MDITQTPAAGDFLLRWRGDVLAVELRLGSPRKGRAALRTNIGNAAKRRREIIAETERGETPLARAWTDIPLAEAEPGVFRADIPLDEIGVFSGKACFFPEGSSVPEWPQGANFHVKVESDEVRGGNSIYTVFPRQFGSFREVARRLDFIMGEMGFRIVQTLPPFPVPTTYAVMGEYGCPFAALDFMSVDPAMAEFDERTTPLDQFRELIDAVHSRKGLFFIDLPANHTGWASTLQTHHPEWFRREADGRFASPGAWGVKWADLVELDYSGHGVRAYMADVFLFWCRNGVDGFRCDAGYMIPAKTWEYIVARVRDEYPDTVFMLEGLGGDIGVTDELLAKSNLDWAYSELFQTFDRSAFEWYLPRAAERGERYGTLIHFAETHDNDRLAVKGETYARLRVQLAALLSWQGGWGIANGVEWYCREKIDVHGKNDLCWGARRNMVALISRLNAILRSEPTFSGAARLQVATRGDGNTLAVVRSSRSLVLANLDCERGAAIDWDRSLFGASEAFDLISERRVKLGAPVALEPGQVMMLVSKPPVPAAAEPPGAPRPAGLFRWSFPRDAHREVCVPEGMPVEVSAPSPFRMRVTDPVTGRTLCVKRSGDGCRAVFNAPRYEGDGTRCRELDISIAVYSPGGTQRACSMLLVPPASGAARARLQLDAAEVRRNPGFRTVLSNGAGAASQVRIGWGTVMSQYDAILAANPNPSVPSDRLVLWTRMRCWIQREGYVREFTAQCVSRFRADPAGRFAAWDFRMPCGMGLETAFTFELSLADGENAARLRVVRRDAGPDDAGSSVRLVFRPDVEWRSFHGTTKAYSGPESLFPGASVPLAGGRGFEFSPYDGTLRMEVSGGEYHHEPQWTYNVAHPEEAGRGQEPAGDLFSPGWISADMRTGDCADIVAQYGRGAKRRRLEFRSPDGAAAPTAPIADVLRRAMELFIVRRDDLKTVIAGYPWFLDWGRDTFIFMRGMIAAGMAEDSLKILKAFAAFEDGGTLPNIIYGGEAGNRDTTDAPLWFIRCVRELDESGMAKEGDIAPLRRTCAAIADSYMRGTPNGIRMDSSSGLVWSPPHFTWMDTNYPACTPRTGYPVEIQALWISALEYLGRAGLAETARKSVERLFKTGCGYCDCLVAPGGEKAADAARDEAVRPNQLFLATLGVIEDPSVLDATGELIVPGGMRSLAAGHPLYKGRYEGDENTMRKQAYHNGTAWAWTFPMYAEAMVETGRSPRETALQLLASAVENLNTGCLCHISEIVDGDAPHAQRGCTAQAWSVSELLRVWLKLGGGAASGGGAAR